MWWLRSRGTALVLAGALVLTACYPELDWREFTSPEGGFTVMLPSKPARASVCVIATFTGRASR